MIIELHIVLDHQVSVIYAVGTMVRIAVEENVVATDEVRALDPLSGIVGDIALLANEYIDRKAAIDLELFAPDTGGPVCAV
jgi:hypothetical protein